MDQGPANWGRWLRPGPGAGKHKYLHKNAKLKKEIRFSGLKDAEEITSK